MRDFLLYALAVAWIPVSIVALTFFVSRDTDRMIANGRKESAERNAKPAR